MSGVRTRARSGTVKARIVKLTPQRGAPRERSSPVPRWWTPRLRYLERDGVHRRGEKGYVYSAERDVEDGRAFLDRTATTATNSGSSSPPRDQAAHIRTDPSPSSECTSAVEPLRPAGIVERIDAIADACLTIFPSAASLTILPAMVWMLTRMSPLR